MSDYHKVFDLLQKLSQQTEASLIALGINARVNVEEDFVFCNCVQEHDALLKQGVEIPVLVDSVPEVAVEMLGVTVVVVPCARFSIPLWKSGEAVNEDFSRRLDYAFSRILLAAAVVDQASADIEKEKLKKN